MKQKTFCISIDVEKDIHKESYESVKKGLPFFAKLAKKHNIKATFFTTCDCIVKHPKVFRDLIKQGHEMAIHGYDHQRFDKLSLEGKKEQLKKCFAVFKKYLNINPKGFRAPQHSVDEETFKVLEENNFLYDSSLSPWNFHHILLPQIEIKFSHNFGKMKPNKINKLWEIPITSFFFPLSAFTIRLLPFWLFKVYLRFVSPFKTKVFLSHSWDFVELENSRMYSRCPLPEFMKRFEYMIEYFKDNNFQAMASFVEK